MSSEILLNGLLIPKYYGNREKIFKIIKEEVITDFTYYYHDKEFEIRGVVNVITNFNNDAYLKNLDAKSKLHVKEGSKFLGIYYLENSINF